MSLLPLRSPPQEPTQEALIHRIPSPPWTLSPVRPQHYINCDLNTHLVSIEPTAGLFLFIWNPAETLALCRAHGCAADTVYILLLLIFACKGQMSDGLHKPDPSCYDLMCSPKVYVLKTESSDCKLLAFGGGVWGK